MTRVKIADLKNNLSRHLARVRAGGDVVVLDRETPIARIVPFERAARSGHVGRAEPYWTRERLAALEQRGVVTRGRAGGLAAWAAATRPIRPPRGTRSAVAMLLQDRRESRR